MQPQEIRMLRSHAALVQDQLDKAIQLDTPERRADFEWAQGEFNKRYPHYKWQDWAPKETEIAR